MVGKDLITKGSHVRLATTKPIGGMGMVSLGSIGVVKKLNPKGRKHADGTQYELLIDFKEQSGWVGMKSDVEVVGVEALKLANKRHIKYKAVLQMPTMDTVLVTILQQTHFSDNFMPHESESTHFIRVNGYYIQSARGCSAGRMEYYHVRLSANPVDFKVSFVLPVEEYKRFKACVQEYNRLGAL